jgi:hypothetical protein
MKKEMNGGVVAGILVVVVLVVALLAWKVLGPPAPAGIKPFNKEELKTMQQEHAQSAKSIADEQRRLYQQSHGGGQ